MMRWTQQIPRKARWAFVVLALIAVFGSGAMTTIMDGVRRVVANYAYAIQFDTDVEAPEEHNPGQMFWDSAAGTLAFRANVAGVTNQIGQESWVVARNETGVEITNGQVVYISGATGNRPTIALARADAEDTSRLLGVATHNIPHNTNGKITAFGLVRDINTSAFSEGDEVFLSAAVSGATTDTCPSAPTDFPVSIGQVVAAHVSNGVILVNIVRTTNAAARSRMVAINIFDSATSVTVGSGINGIPIPAGLDGLELTDVLATVNTKGVTATTDVMVVRRRGGANVDMLTTPVTIGDEFFANDETVNTSNDDLATGDEIYFDVDATHSGTAPYGLSVVCTFE